MTIAVFRNIVRREIQSGPDELGPDIIRNDPRIWSDLGKHALGCDKATNRIEAPGNHLPLLQVAEKDTKHREMAGVSAGGKRLTLVFDVGRSFGAPVS